MSDFAVGDLVRLKGQPSAPLMVVCECEKVQPDNDTPERISFTCVWWQATPAGGGSFEYIDSLPAEVLVSAVGVTEKAE